METLKMKKKEVLENNTILTAMYMMGNGKKTSRMEKQLCITKISTLTTAISL
jgi:hypothetical protein